MKQGVYYSIDDGWIKTHEDARDLIKSLCPGLKVYFQRIQESNRDATNYTVVMERFGQVPLSAASVYALPFPADRMTRTIKRKLEEYFK